MLWLTLIAAGCVTQPTPPVSPSGSVAKDAALPPTLVVTDPVTLQDFEFVLVPGDDAKGIAPFYMMRDEVSWDQFRPWMHGRFDAYNLDEALQRKIMRLGPSEGMFANLSQDMGWGQQPALRMSRINAACFCEALSDLTEYRLRLPTEAEWEHAFVSGGGDLDAHGPLPDAEDYATLKTTDDGWQSWPVTRGKLNALGIRNMLGNVAEWVTDTGNEHVVRGGSMNDPASEVTGAWRAVEDQRVWNEHYPNNPVSQWWYVDAFWVGFRIVCEVPETP